VIALLLVFNSVSLLVLLFVLDVFEGDEDVVVVVVVVSVLDGLEEEKEVSVVDFDFELSLFMSDFLVAVVVLVGVVVEWSVGSLRFLGRPF